jgi:hypothetical protein
MLIMKVRSSQSGTSKTNLILGLLGILFLHSVITITSFVI